MTVLFRNDTFNIFSSSFYEIFKNEIYDFLKELEYMTVEEFEQKYSRESYFQFKKHKIYFSQIDSLIYLKSIESN